MYVADVNQQVWDGYAERLTFALNTAHDQVRGETSFFLVHGWDPRSTLEAVVSVWLYLDRVKEGYARKLAHMWHGPFRVTELIGNHAARDCRLKVSDLPDCTSVEAEASVNVPGSAEGCVEYRRRRSDFDEELLPDDSWDTPLDEDEFEVERIADPTWVDEADLNCAALLYEYERGRTSRNRFNVMQSHEEGVNHTLGG
ncbi:LOW QUALITY PROTEIN: reverse transcriptase [Phytophthora megakarya]|uniref:Reverse transcriptase n=1 Tax=Phytophthora megakarya TaxID=4795 RepID=A0A225UDP8_9STRA|nr:LOW QUALITY PROTEIN: reverse transcriptase [Phytophthora megakarya]